MNGSCWWLVPASCLVLLAPTPLPAQPSAPPDTTLYQAPEIVVTALRGRDSLSRVPAAAFVFTREDLVRAASPRISTLLETLPGLYAYRADATGAPGVVDPRGFTANGESSYLKVLVDGHDLRDVENGNVDWDWLSPESIDRLEVVEGAGAWLYGDGAEGGIVNIVRAESPEGFHGRSSIRGGSFGQRGAGVEGSGGFASWNASLRSGFRDTDGWRDHSREQIRSAGGEASWQVAGRGRLALDAAWLDSDRDDPGALTPEQIAADRTQSETTTDFTRARRLLAGARLSAGEGSNQALSLGGFLRDEDVDQVRTIFTPVLHPTRGRALGADLGWRHSFAPGHHPLAVSAGYQIERARLDSKYRDAPGGTGALLAHDEATRLTHSGFGGLQLDLPGRLTARAGLRGDAIRVRSESKLAGNGSASRTLSAVSPFGSLNRQLGAHGTVYGSWSLAFHAPTLNQLFDQRSFFGATISNPRLEPQRASSVELGARGAGPRRGSWSLAFYSARVRDEIDFELSTFSYANIGRSWHRGAQLAIAQPIMGSLSLQANGAYTPTTIRGGSNDGHQINAVPQGTAYGRLAWSERAWSVGSGVRWVGLQWLDKENQHPLGDFATVELAGAVRFAHLGVSARVGNLLDRKYADTGFIGASSEERLVPAAGRNVSGAITFE